jgi:hypothetical protein
MSPFVKSLDDDGALDSRLVLHRLGFDCCGLHVAGYDRHPNSHIMRGEQKDRKVPSAEMRDSQIQDIPEEGKALSEKFPSAVRAKGQAVLVTLCPLSFSFLYLSSFGMT